MLRHWFTICLISVFTAGAEEVPVWTTGTGTTTIVFQQGLLRILDFTVRGDSNGAYSANFSMTADSAIKFVSPWGSPDSFLGGSLKCDHGFALTAANDGRTNSVAISPLELFALKDTDVFELRDEDGEPVFTMDGLDVHFDPGLHAIFLRRGNLRISKDFAQAIGRAELAGFVVGVVDCEIEVRELDARIARKPRPLPAACGLPAGTNATLKLRGVGEVQMIDEPSHGLCPVAADVALENSGPDALELAALENTRLGLSLLVVKGGATSELVRVEQPMRVDPAERCPCPDETKFYPGFVARRSLADVIAQSAWLPVPVETLDAAARGDALLFFEARLGSASARRPVKPERRGPGWIFR